MFEVTCTSLVTSLYILLQICDNLSATVPKQGTLCQHAMFNEHACLICSESSIGKSFKVASPTRLSFPKGKKNRVFSFVFSQKKKNLCLFTSPSFEHVCLLSALCGSASQLYCSNTNRNLGHLGFNAT